MKKTILIGLAAVGFVVWACHYADASSRAAQPPKPAPDIKSPFDQMDANRDGAVTRQEFQAYQQQAAARRARVAQNAPAAAPNRAQSQRARASQAAAESASRAARRQRTAQTDRYDARVEPGRAIDGAWANGSRRWTGADRASGKRFSAGRFDGNGSAWTGRWNRMDGGANADRRAIRQQEMRDLRQPRRLQAREYANPETARPRQMYREQGAQALGGQRRMRHELPGNMPAERRQELRRRRTQGSPERTRQTSDNQQSWGQTYQPRRDMLNESTYGPAEGGLAGRRGAAQMDAGARRGDAGGPGFGLRPQAQGRERSSSMEQMTPQDRRQAMHEIWSRMGGDERREMMREMRSEEPAGTGERSENRGPREQTGTSRGGENDDVMDNWGLLSDMGLVPE